MHARETPIKISHMITNTLMDEHLVNPTRAQKMIQVFLTNLKRDMKIIFQNLAAHEVASKSLSILYIVSISSYHETWVAYIRD
jgi:hypothetical protein